jgi:hypothetical protein
MSKCSWQDGHDHIIPPSSWWYGSTSKPLPKESLMSAGNNVSDRSWCTTWNTAGLSLVLQSRILQILPSKSLNVSIPSMPFALSTQVTQDYQASFHDATYLLACFSSVVEHMDYLTLGMLQFVCAYQNT